MNEVPEFFKCIGNPRLTPMGPEVTEKFREKGLSSVTCDIQIRINNNLVKEMSYSEESLDNINRDIGAYLVAGGYTDKYKYHVDVLVKNINYIPAISLLSVWNTD